MGGPYEVLMCAGHLPTFGYIQRNQLKFDLTEKSTWKKNRECSICRLMECRLCACQVFWRGFEILRIEDQGGDPSADTPDVMCWLKPHTMKQN